MIHVFMDFETRSKVDIKDTGASKYAADPSTLPLMLAYGNDSGHAQWALDLSAPDDVPECPAKLRALIENPDVVFHAHNAAFEMLIWDRICVQRWGWPRIAHDRWYCTAARAAAANQPRQLGAVGKRVGLPEGKQKESRGRDLIKALSTPTKAQTGKTRDRIGPDGEKVKKLITLKSGKQVWRVVKDPNTLGVDYLAAQGIPTFEMTNEKGKTYTYFFNPDPKLMAEFRAYNLQDIVAEREVHKRLPPPHELERPLWLLDREINQRGIPVDLDLCRGALQVYETEVVNAWERLAIITNGEATRTTQVQRIVKWLNERCNFGDSLAEDAVNAWLKANPGAPDEVKEVLFLRQLAGGTAVSKYKAALAYVEEDGRVRDQVLYYGATTTGRWSGKGIQPHNFKREKTLDETYIEALKTGNHATVEALGAIDGRTVFDVLKGCLRGIICAPSGKLILRSDFSGIESRVLNWICRNEVKLDLFRRGQDNYIHTALDVYKCTYEDIATWNGKKWKIKPEHSEKRQIGKAMELGLGYGMGWVTFQSNAADQNQILSDEFAAEVVNTWRSANPEIPEFWKRIEKACRFVIRFPNKRADVNGLKVFWDPRGYLCIRLPSGRLLRYYAAEVHKDRDPDSLDEFPQIYYLDGGKAGSGVNGGKISTYGGKLCENIVQAISRDLLVHSMFIIARAGVPLIFHVHDEVVAEIDEDDNTTFDIVHQAMQTVPPWAPDLPLDAETEVSRRFSK